MFNCRAQAPVIGRTKLDRMCTLVAEVGIGHVFFLGRK